MAKDFDNRDSGILFNNDRKVGRGPDMTGNIELSKDTLRSLIELAKANKPIKLWLSVWYKESRRGSFQSIAVRADGAPIPGREAPQERETPRETARPALTTVERGRRESAVRQRDPRDDDFPESVDLRKERPPF